MSHPQEHIAIEPRSVEITRMGFKPDPRSTQDRVDTVNYMEVQYMGQTFVGGLTRFARDDLLPERRLRDARVL